MYSKDMKESDEILSAAYTCNNTVAIRTSNSQVDEAKKYNTGATIVLVETFKTPRTSVFGLPTCVASDSPRQRGVNRS